MNRTDVRSQSNRDELVELLSAGCKSEGTNQIVDNLQFFKWNSPTQRNHGLYLPSICVIAQGAKEVQFGDERLRYDPSNYLLTSLDSPVTSQVVEATTETPYLGLKLEFDPTMIASVMVETGLAPGRSDLAVKSMAVSSLEHDLLDAFVRLLRLTRSSDDYRVVSPMVTREIIYRILKGEQGPRMRQMATLGGHTHRMAKAVQVLRTKFNEPLSIETLANELGMSVSSFHQHFKTTTSMSPLQYQKALRLQEARRLLLTEKYDAAQAAQKVGYDDSSQFSREYKRLFGEPPMRDVERFKHMASAAG